ncbi:retrovirus-related pol polyprotein from transposon TNT 1-94 [Tanacetum coccineum]|uniref:Retrovirus-related pol polyprotein from transposon TNT 1-94 n=1 Tax=Tanacetum coccineum TaxID=301880 RepID=A0ABQ4XDE4_9ASTR
MSRALDIRPLSLLKIVADTKEQVELLHKQVKRVEVVCYKCGEKGHIKRYCKNPKKKNQNSNKKDESANAVEQVDITKITAMVFEMNIGMIHELHMASVTTTDDWWYDSGATTHVTFSFFM